MKIKSIAFAVLGLVITDVAQAQNTGGPFSINVDPSSVAASTSLGWLHGEAKEYVYDGDSGRKISQLKWKINNTAIIKGDISWDTFSWLTLNAKGWSSLGSSGAKMDDYDWLNDNQSHWTGWSHSPDTHLNYANEYDLNSKLWLLKRPDYKIGAVLGYQQTRFSWTAFGGRYQYDNGTRLGEFPPGVRGIGYQQKFSMPYVGLNGSYRFRDFEFSTLLKYSSWVKARDNDEHYMRSLTFRDKSQNANYYSAAVNAGYYVTPNAKVFTEFTWNKYARGKGGTQIIDRTSGEKEHIGGDVAGIENTSYSVTAGLEYRF